MSSNVVKAIGCITGDSWVAALGVGVVGAVAMNTSSDVGTGDTVAVDL